ncbi:hypothetical protein [Streptomyces sp. NPDC001435]|uniref:hypothetical protein n=1 Tax=unclassified Streptomyces TaxID=2593676 RepID=UPI0036B8A4B7
MQETQEAHRLLAAWAAVVRGLDEGYGWCAPEFGHDIWCRTRLARLWPVLPAEIRTAQKPLLDRIDEQFRAATVPWPGREGERGFGWWHRRVPRLLESEPGEVLDGGWPLGWEMMPFPKPDEVRVVVP